MIKEKYTDRDRQIVESGWKQGYKDGLAKGRADAIDKFAELLCQYVYDKDFMSDDVIRNIAEQLKEQKNE